MAATIGPEVFIGRLLVSNSKQMKQVKIFVQSSGRTAQDTFSIDYNPVSPKSINELPKLCLRFVNVFDVIVTFHSSLSC